MLRSSPRQVLWQAQLIALIWLLLLFALWRETNPAFLPSGISFANFLAVAQIALRVYPLAVWREMGLLLLLTCLMIVNILLISLLFGVTAPALGQYIAIASAGTLVVGTVMRLITRLWHTLNKLRQRYFAWSLTYAHLMFVEMTLLGGLVGFFAFLWITFWLPAQLDNPSLTLVEYLLYIEPLFIIGGSLTLLMMLVILPPSVFFSYLVSRRLVRRLLLLEQATAQVEQGDYTTQIPIEGSDEIARLQARYNAMTQQLDSTIQKLHIEQVTVAGLLKLQREMVANISHDLRTPLTTLHVYLDTLSAAPETDLIRQEIHHLRRLTDDLFDAAQNETLALTLRLAPTPVKPLLEKIVAVTSATARTRQQVELFMDVPPDLPDLLLDADRFSQIIRNLLQNALRWTPPGGMIQVTARQAGTAVQVDVRDTGIGIAEDDLSNIWRRAYRGETSEGSGLGLATVRQLVEAMQGSISVESVVNEGSCFRLMFPIKAT